MVVGLILLIPIVLIALIPTLLNTRGGNRIIGSRLNKVFTPGHLGFKTIQLSWFKSTRLTEVVLDDPTGKPVVRAPSATLTPSLWGLVTHPNRLGDLTLNEAVFEIERKGDGSVDIAEALEGIIRAGDPRRDLTILADRAKLRLTLPNLAEPIQADRMDLVIHIRPDPGLLDWSFHLTTGSDQSLRISGDFDRWKSKPSSVAKPDLTLDVASIGWPIALDVEKVVMGGRFDGKFSINRVAGQLKTSGTAEMKNLKAKGERFKGDTLDIKTVAAAWSIVEVADGWSVDRFDLHSPLGSLVAVLPQPSDPARPAKIEGELQLASIAQQLPHVLRLREGLKVDRGTATLTVIAKPGSARSEWSVEAKLADLAATQGTRKLTFHDSTTLSALIVRRDMQLAVDRLDVKTGFLDISAHGDLDRGVSLTGSLDLASLRTQLAEWLDLGSIDMSGRGTLSAVYNRRGSTYVGETRMDVAGLRVIGLSATPILADHASFSGRAEGPADSFGLPRSLAKANLSLDAKDYFAEAELRPEGGLAALAINVRAPVRVSDRDGRVEASLTGRWDAVPRSLEIENVQLGLRPDRGDPTLLPLSWSANGRLDVGSGALTLRPTEPIDHTSPITLGPEGLKVAGLGRSGEPLRVEAGWLGDLGALDRVIAGWTGRLPKDIAGTWTASARVEPVKAGLNVAARLELANLSWPTSKGRQVSEAPLTFSTQSLYHVNERRLDIADLSLITPWGTVHADGQMDRLGRESLVDVKGTLAPDWKALSAVVAEQLEPGAKVTGQARPFRIKGALQGSENSSPFEADFGVDLTSADLFGMSLGATPIGVHLRGGTVAIDPIDTTLNEGQLHLVPRLVIDQAKGSSLFLEKGTRLENAVVNDRVSRRVLSFVAPVLDQATRASGRISMTIERAEFPIASDVGRKLNVTGSVLFQDVEFAPGPLTRQIIGMVSQKEPENVRLDEPVRLSIADGRVHQTGLAVRLGKVTRLEVEGWVDFDKNLDVIASIPLTPAMVGNNPVLGEMVAGTKFQVPITGSLAAPKFDKEAFRLGMKDLGKSLLTRSVGVGALELLNQLAKPRAIDPDAPPPPPRLTPDERKAQRIEKRNDRRRLRGLDPLPMPDAP